VNFLNTCVSDAFYTTLWNVLDYPCVAFPVTVVDLELDKNIEERTEFYNHEDEAIYKLCTRISAVCGLNLTSCFSDDSELFQDSPIGLQITCRTQEEEAVLAMAEIIKNALENEKV
jgi:amidase